MRNEQDIRKIILAYSGGLDTSVILAWLKERYGCEVIAFAADVGQGEELAGLEEKALRTGATRCSIIDLREEFARDFIFPAVRAGAVYERRYLLGTALARPLIAKAQVEIAGREDADSVSHGATGKGNDQVRFELAFMALAPHLKIIAPWRIWDLHSRSGLIEYAKTHGIPVPVTVEKPYSMDRNLMHVSYEGGILEDTYCEPKADMFRMTVSPEDAPDQPAYLELHFVEGNAVGIDGRELSPLQIMEALNDIGGRHGIGRVDIVENRLVGMKSRGVYETPGGAILHAAHYDIECLTMERDTQHMKERLAIEYAGLVYNGQWFSPRKRALDAMIAETQRFVTGDVRLKLYKGNIIVVGRKSVYALYDKSLATFEEDNVYNQKDAEGFIRLFGLPVRTTHTVQAESKS